ncbi:MAG: LPXTG cell wall anchor domain-containing protein [Lachnospiraceae bacterium]|nr:LPXTG cell wall anchor domain-containing protein [Lachnospiraceae bacterium]
MPESTTALTQPKTGDKSKTADLMLLGVLSGGIALTAGLGFSKRRKKY